MFLTPITKHTHAHTHTRAHTYALTHIRTLTPQEDPGHLKFLTDAMLIGLAPVLAFGALVSFFRLRVLQWHALRAIRCAHACVHVCACTAPIYLHLMQRYPSAGFIKCLNTASLKCVCADLSYAFMCGYTSKHTTNRVPACLANMTAQIKIEMICLVLAGPPPKTLTSRQTSGTCTDLGSPRK